MRYRASLSPGLERLKAETPEGHCIFCGREAFGGSICCRRRECRLAWSEVWRDDRLERLRVHRAARYGLASVLRVRPGGQVLAAAKRRRVA